MKIAVITVSDRAFAGVYADAAGPAVVEEIRSAYPDCEIEAEIVPDGIEPLLEALRRHDSADWILTTGGTGPSPRDLAPEATLAYCDRTVPGIAEFLRARSIAQTPNAVFSRCAAGMKGSQFVVNFPGSVRAARFHAQALIPVLEHGPAMARGEGH